MINEKWLAMMPQTTIEHLPYVSFDHTPLLMEMVIRQDIHTKYFKFLHFWVENDTFLDTMKT